MTVCRRNNHLVSLRSDLLRASLSLSPRRQVRMVALHWPISSAATPQDVVHSICASRIVRRGANHQTLRAGEDHEGILARFIGAVEGFGGIEDVEFDHVLEMDIKWSQEESLKKVLELLVRVVEGLEMPEEEKIQEAMRVAAGYKPVFKKAGITVEAKQKHDKKLAAKAPRYYGLAVEIDLKKVIGDIFDSNGADPTLFKLLVDSDRVELAPHITLVHEKERESLDPALKLIVDDLWIRYSTLIESSVAPADAAVDETPLVVELILGPTITYDSRVMSLQVSSIISSSGIELRDSGAHITIGTIAQEVRPIEGKWLMEKALKGETETEGGLIRTIKIEPITCKGRLAGMR
jgi:tRNA ligase